MSYRAIISPHREHDGFAINRDWLVASGDRKLETVRRNGHPRYSGHSSLVTDYRVFCTVTCSVSITIIILSRGGSMLGLVDIWFMVFVLFVLTVSNYSVERFILRVDSVCIDLGIKDTDKYIEWRGCLSCLFKAIYAKWSGIVILSPPRLRVSVCFGWKGYFQ